MNWIDAPTTGPPVSFPGLHPLAARTLARRGLTTPGALRGFLDPQAYSPAPATDLPGLSRAADRVAQAVHRREPVCVWGDFDVDGQTSTTILVEALQTLGADVTYHIPRREGEGHGVHVPTLERIIERGARLILTCDTGISAHAAVEFARERGVEFVITDHHDLPETLPPALAAVNPKFLPPEHPLATLSGSGVAFKLAEELYARLGRSGEEPPSVDLAALGLVADLAVLRGDARHMVQRGLTVLRNTTRLGLQTMMELAELVPANLTEEHISFALAPRLNALGRLGDANPAVELLTTSDPGRARLLATQLENYNVQRRLLTSQVTEAAEALLRADPSLLAQPVLVLDGPSWPGGVVGIAAARLVERYRKPAILFSTPADGVARGSARSVEGLNITAAIAAQKDLLLNFGGHPMAAGLALPQENLPEFRRRLARTVEAMLGEAALEEPVLTIEAWLGLPEVTLELAEALEALAPYGPGNEKLTLATRGLTLQSAAPLGRNKEHLKLTVADAAGNACQVLWWNGAGEGLPEGRFDLAYLVRASDWRGGRQVQVEFTAFRPADDEEPVEIRARKVEVLDLRNLDNPQAALESLLPGTLIWVEGEEKERLGGLDRNSLVPAAGLAIWSIPPSPDELRQALEAVRPERVYLIAAGPTKVTAEAFVARLAGLVKYALNRRDGQATLDELAAGTGQRVAAVRLGLGWLLAGGKVSLVGEGEDGRLHLAAGTGRPDASKADKLWAEIRSLLEETAAYRAHFRQAGKDALISS